MLTICSPSYSASGARTLPLPLQMSLRSAHAFTTVLGICGPQKQIEFSQRNSVAPHSPTDADVGEAFVRIPFLPPSFCVAYGLHSGARHVLLE